MAQTTVPNSPDIAVLDFKLTGDLCGGNFIVDLSPSIFKGTGAQAALGAKVKITNPFDVDIKPYGLSYDIIKTGTPASLLNSVYLFPVPKVNTNYQYGLYVVEVELTDSAGIKHLAFHNLSICEPNPKDKTQIKGTINAQLIANCVKGTVTVLIDEPPIYKGKAFESKTQSSTLTYPSGTIAVPYVTIASAFSVRLYEGVYLLKSELCVTYNLGENNYVKVPYAVNCKKNILCIVDLCCVFDKLSQINLQLAENCSASEKEHLIDVTFDALRILKTIELGASCGEDVSDYIEQLEALLKCKCSCASNAGTPIVNNAPAKDFVITGCNVTKSVAGLTDTYTIENYAYQVTTNPAKSFITIGAPILTGCVMVQQLDFNVAGLYTEIKTLINTNAEYNYWAGIIGQSLNGLPKNLLACLGLTDAQWNALTFREKFLSTITKFCGCCEGSDCSPIIADHIATSQGQTTLLSWEILTTAQPSSFDIYINDVLISTVLFPKASIVLTGFNNSLIHTYKIVAKCSNGAIGNTVTGTFNHAGCNFVVAPSLSSINVQNASCPFNLNSLVAAVQGLTVVWYNSSIVSAATLVPNPAAVTSGLYYAYQRDVNGCLSAPSQVAITCATASNCTEPLNLLVQRGTSNGAAATLVTFSSPSNPAPSYIVKRRLSSDPDVNGSYTTIGTPTFNLSANQYQIFDNTNVVNTLYVYKAESQCTDGGRPSAFFTYAHIPCPALTLTPTSNSIAYSFTPSAINQLNKIEAILYDENNIVLNTTVFNPVFPATISGTFTGLLPNKIYKVGLALYIGTYKSSCGAQNVTTAPPPANWTVQNIMTGVSEFINFSFNINATVDVASGTSANSSPFNLVTGTSNLIPVSNGTVVFKTGTRVGLVVTLNGLAATVNGSNYTWSAFTSGTALEFVISGAGAP